MVLEQIQYHCVISSITLDRLMYKNYRSLYWHLYTNIDYKPVEAILEGLNSQDDKCPYLTKKINPRAF